MCGFAGRFSSILALVLAFGCKEQGGESRVEAGAKTPPAEQTKPADLIVRSGAVWTGTGSPQGATAVAVRDGTIVAVGDEASVFVFRGPDTEVVGGEGTLVVPGFNDNHVHFAAAAEFLEFNVMKVGSQTEFEAAVRDVVTRVPEGEWITGGYWGAYDQWGEASSGSRSRDPFTPDLAPLEALTAKHPLFIRKFDDSEFAANAAALRAAGLDPAKSTQGIVFRRDAGGTFHGILEGPEVVEAFEEVMPKSFSHERRVIQTRNALREIRRHGVTNISDMSDDEQLEIYRELHAKGELTVRVHFRPHLETWKQLKAQGVKVGSGDPWIRLGAVKGHIDGIMGTHGARFFDPYDDQPGNRGRWRRLMVDERGEFVEGKFLGYMLGADAAGIQLSVHAIGDEANHLLLDYLEELERKNGKKDRRFRLVHAQVLAPDDMVRLGKLGVVAEVQPFHLSDDMRWMEERIGTKRCEGAYAFKDIVDSGAVLSFGTDWPGTSAAEYPINPMFGLYAAVTRQTLGGDPAQGWFPDQRISLEQAMRAYTQGTAYANFEDDLKGTIEVGKLADLTVLDRNILELPPQAWLETQVVYTIVDGRIVYAKDGSSHG